MPFGRPRQELRDFDYEGRGYPTRASSDRRSLAGYFSPGSLLRSFSNAADAGGLSFDGLSSGEGRVTKCPLVAHIAAYGMNEKRLTYRWPEVARTPRQLARAADAMASERGKQVMNLCR